MQLAHRRNQKTLLGAVVFLLVTAVIVYLFISFVSNYQINRIAKLNEKYDVSSGYLVPDDYLGYTIELEGLGEDKYTGPITDYLELKSEAKILDRHLSYSLLETNCVTRNTLTRIEMQIQNKEELLYRFNNTYSKKLDKLFWKSYIESLESYDIERIKEKAQKLEMC